MTTTQPTQHNHPSNYNHSTTNDFKDLIYEDDDDNMLYNYDENYNKGIATTALLFGLAVLALVMLITFIAIFTSK